MAKTKTKKINAENMLESLVPVAYSGKESHNEDMAWGH
jgi:hypothetical protein